MLRSTTVEADGSSDTEKTVTPDMQAEAEKKEKMGTFANFTGQRRYEVGVLIDVLAGASRPIRLRELFEEVRRRVDCDQQDGLDPPYRITSTLVRATLGIMTDLGAVQSKWNGVSLTPRVLEVIDRLKHTIPMGRDYREPTSRV